MSAEVEAAREAFERQLDGARTAVKQEFGRVPRLAWWFLPVAAATVGLALGMRRRRRRRAAISRPSGA